MSGTVSREFITGLERRRRDAYNRGQALCQRATAQGRGNLTPEETREFDEYRRTVAGLTEHIRDCRDDLQRSVIPEEFRNLGGGGRTPNTAWRARTVALQR
jgi:hypothetical protein